MFIFAKQSPTLQKKYEIVLFEIILYTEGYYFHKKIKNMHVKCSSHKCV